MVIIVAPDAFNLWLDCAKIEEAERSAIAVLVCAEHDPEKWKPVFRKDHALRYGRRRIGTADVRF